MEQETMEEMKKPRIVNQLPPLGFGNPDSSISHKKQLENGELSPEVDAALRVAILSGEAVVEVHNRDDGCIDGRPTEKLYDTTSGQKLDAPVDNSNHERAKVAGGGYITAQAMRLGAGVIGATIDNDLLNIGADLAQKEIYCGAHSGSHQHGDGTDCGANDKFPLILENALLFKDGVQAKTKELLEIAGVQFDETVYTQVLTNWQAALDKDGYFEGSTGASRLKNILATQDAARTPGEKPVAVTKHLRGDHNEDAIIVNYVQGTTMSQGTLKEILSEKFPENDDAHLAQVFVVDAWRIVELAQNAVDKEDFLRALYAGVAYQVATAATLTDGSLPMYTYTLASE